MIKRGVDESENTKNYWGITEKNLEKNIDNMEKTGYNRKE